MKLSVRSFALSIAVLGAAAAVVPTGSGRAVNQQMVSAAHPMPICSPTIPSCPHPGGSLR